MIVTKEMAERTEHLPDCAGWEDCDCFSKRWGHAEIYAMQGAEGLIWNKTRAELPPESPDMFLLGEGDNISGNVNGRYSIMRYDGEWWNEDGTELSEPPEWWAFIPPPAQ